MTAPLTQGSQKKRANKFNQIAKFRFASVDVHIEPTTPNVVIPEKLRFDTFVMHFLYSQLQKKSDVL